MPARYSRSVMALGLLQTAILVTILAAGIGGMVAINIVRGYVVGETNYSKAQKSAVLALHRYAESRDTGHFTEYARYIQVPINIRRAREILEDPERRVAESYPFLIRANHHPDDVAGIAWLFRLFGDTALFAPSIEVWRRADGLVQTLHEQASALDRRIRSDTPSEAEIADRIAEIDALDRELTVLQSEFSERMGHAARTMARQLYTWIGGLGLALVLIGAGGALGASRRVSAAAEEIRESEQRFRDVAELSADWIWETDAAFRTRFLSDRLEAVTGRPKSAFLGWRRWELQGRPVAGEWADHIATLERHEPFAAFDYVLDLPDGGQRVFRLSGKPIFAADGRFLGYRGTGTDVTAETEARREARERQELLETIFENLGQGICVVDDALNLATLNRRVLELLDIPEGYLTPGESLETFIRLNAERGLFGPGTVETLVQEQLARARAPGSDSFERTRPDGRVIEVRAQPLPSGGFVATYRDITEERRTRAALTASERRTRAVLEGALDSIVTMDSTGRITEFNPAAERTFGWSRADALGQRVSNLLIPERYREEHNLGLERYLRLGETRIIGRRIETTALHADGSEIPAELSVTASASDGAPTFIGFLRDVTGRRRSEEERQAAEERLWAFLDGSPDAISLKDAEGRYVLCNKTFERLCALAKESIAGLTDREVFPDNPELCEAIARHDEQVVATRRPVLEERALRHADGRVQTFRVAKFPVFAGDVTLAGIGQVGQDITGLKDAEHQLRQAIRMQAVGQLTGGVAHDFNNLLAVVLGNLELLQEHLAEDPAARDLADHAVTAAERGATITRRLLAFARRQPLAPQSVNLAHLLETISGLLRRSLGETIELELRTAPDLWPCIADPAELESALLNLAINARDAMPDGGRLSIEVANIGVGPGSAQAGGHCAELDLPDGDYVLISVGDTGLGMSPETQERAFEPFFTTKEAGRGTGLGLSQVQGFARQSDGEARLFSVAGQGTTVCIWLPRAGAGAEAPAPTAEDAPDAVPPPNPAGGERILLAEDEELVREHVRAQLRSLGYKVVAVRDGPAALDKLAGENGFDLLLTDVAMPGGLSGFELAQKARRLRPDLPVLFTSGYIETALPDLEEFTPGGELLQKPYRRQELAAKVRAAIERCRA